MILEENTITQELVQTETVMEPSCHHKPLKVGDVITIQGLDLAQGVINGVERKWIVVKCTGSVDSVALSTLVGTMKVLRHFGEKIAYDPRLLRLPHTKKEAAMAVADLVGKSYEVVAKKTVFLEKFSNDKTYYVFFEK